MTEDQLQQHALFLSLALWTGPAATMKTTGKRLPFDTGKAYVTLYIAENRLYAGIEALDRVHSLCVVHHDNRVLHNDKVLEDFVVTSDPRSCPGTSVSQESAWYTLQRLTADDITLDAPEQFLDKDYRLVLQTIRRQS